MQIFSPPRRQVFMLERVIDSVFSNFFIGIYFPGLRSSMSLTQVIKKTERNPDMEECLPDLPVPSSYEKAMEALSSLITRQKRGGNSSLGGTYGKLERMSMYLKVAYFAGMLKILEHAPMRVFLYITASTELFCCTEKIQILGLEEKINDLKIIHIAGTKGKVGYA